MNFKLTLLSTFVLIHARYYPEQLSIKLFLATVEHAVHIVRSRPEALFSLLSNFHSAAESWSYGISCPRLAPSF